MALFCRIFSFLFVNNKSSFGYFGKKQLKTNPALPHQSHCSKLTIVNYCKTTIAFILYFYSMISLLFITCKNKKIINKPLYFFVFLVNWRRFGTLSLSPRSWKRTCSCLESRIHHLHNRIQAKSWSFALCASVLIAHITYHKCPDTTAEKLFV